MTTLVLPFAPPRPSQATWEAAPAHEESVALIEPNLALVEVAVVFGLSLSSSYSVSITYASHTRISRNMGDVRSAVRANDTVVRRAGFYGGGIGTGLALIGGSAAACAAGVVDDLPAVLGVGIALAVVGLLLLVLSALSVRSLDHTLD